MYVTRHLSQLLRSPETMAAQPDGPNSGYLVIADEESETYSCFGLCKNTALYQMPFPQNKELTVQFVTNAGQYSQIHLDPVFLIPVLNQPLSSNQYYAIVPHGKHIGEAFTCSKEEDKATCCFCRCIKDVKPRPLDPRDIYQKIQIVPNKATCVGKGSYYAESIASDGFPPYFLLRLGWTIFTKSAENCTLDTAEGVDSKNRTRLPEFEFSLPRKSSQSSFVGKWYSPFVFVSEGTLRDQVKKSMYYEITLEQRWEQIFTCNRNFHNNQGNSVAIDVLIDNEEAFIDGIKVVWSDKAVVEGIVWFTAMGKQKRVGLRVEVVQRMKWEEERFGYLSGEDRRTKINRVEEYKGGGEWSEFGCYVLVERFNFRRRDGSLVMCYDFKHSDKTKTKWQ